MYSLKTKILDYFIKNFGLLYKISNNFLYYLKNRTSSRHYNFFYILTNIEIPTHFTKSFYIYLYFFVFLYLFLFVYFYVFFYIYQNWNFLKLFCIYFKAEVFKYLYIYLKQKSLISQYLFVKWFYFSLFQNNFPYTQPDFFLIFFIF